MDFNNLNDLLRYAQDKINKTLKNEVAIVAREEMQEQIQEKVYDAYDPYNPDGRRMYDDGLIDSRNIEISIVNDDTISIENIAYDGNRNIPYIVESGEGYEYGSSPILTKGRKFTQATRDSLSNSNTLENAMKDGLHRQGFDIR
ncbi:hypothetical protein NV379_02655 [Paenibacillus sp. N1-5-1-14]|uniref:hypothetical protein n=1 Tax=Paenibacillus radicibacter TaxID=2972488 RepID=UPI002158A72F|nr:hypothetical protein [Paenibacillus radicibacter]MCR8641547.1 hypothetical protein [Paenibacillus radicibacter]